MIIGKGDPNIRVQIQQAAMGLSWNVFVYRRALGGSQCLTIGIDENGQMEFTWGDPLPDFSVIDKSQMFLSIPADIFPQFAKAFLDAGFELPSESYLKGQVEATGKHLEDMRKLVFKDGPSNQ